MHMYVRKTNVHVHISIYITIVWDSLHSLQECFPPLDCVRVTTMFVKFDFLAEINKQASFLLSTITV